MKKQLQNEAATLHPSSGEQGKESRRVSVEWKRGCGNGKSTEGEQKQGNFHWLLMDFMSCEQLSKKPWAFQLSP